MELIDYIKVRITRSRLFIFFMACLISIFCAGNLHANSQVTAHYKQSSGRELEVEILIPSPPPASIIFVQTLPADVKIQLSRPQAKSINAKKGEAKWLLRNLQPGKMSISFSINREVQRNEISGEIRYKTPDGKNMVNQPVK